jgi:hypothetical protein
MLPQKVARGRLDVPLAAAGSTRTPLLGMLLLSALASPTAAAAPSPIALLQSLLISQTVTLLS